jgi:outer membrane receptor protein involved in Fe transport
MRTSGVRCVSGVLALLAISGAASGVRAQTITASVRGVLSHAPKGAVVRTRNLANDQAATAAVAAGGVYALTGLQPGDYDLTYPGEDGALRHQTITVGVGQALTLDLDSAAPAAVGEVVVTGRRTPLVETRTSEVATNVTQVEIRNLPQTDRNFLSFAALAPGVRYNDTEFNRGFTSGAGGPSDVNVFIDGLSLKNDVLAGGVAGQQDSRGNPFPQLAVSEFRVLTQNFKAEYEQADSAVITAVTKSGGNDFHGEAFFQYTDKNLTEQDVFSKEAGAPKPDYEREQYGASLGGPIIKDRLFFFAAYEGNQQTRAEQVRLNSTDPALLQQFGQYLGFFQSPFREDLGFGKLTFTPDDRQTFDLSANIRRESDIRGFGRNTAYTAGTSNLNDVDTFLLRHTYRGQGFVNEAALSYLNYSYNPSKISDGPTYNYLGYIEIGGATSDETVRQKGLTFRDDLTFSQVSWHGSHIVKIGLKYAHQDYDYDDASYTQPYYEYRYPELGIPYLAYLAQGNPDVRAANNQVGLYAQDDWQVDRHLTLNIGLRWDYETNLFDNNFVTPPAVAAALRALPTTFYYTNPEDYITNGNQRSPDWKMFQPRLGFSYDIFGDQRSVVFGAYGHYYDRNVFSNTVNERAALQYQIGTYYFSRDGSVNVEGQPTVVFNPSYLTAAGLTALKAQAQTGFTQIYVVKNDAKAPQTDEFTLGYRQKFGPVFTSISGAYIRGYNGLTNIFLNRDTTTGDCCVTGPGTPAGNNGFSYITGETDQLKTRYLAMYVTVEKPYTDASRWGLSIAYTLSHAEQNGDPSIYGLQGSNDYGFYSYNCLSPDSCGYHSRATDALHTLVISGQVLLPFDIRFSTLTTMTSPQPYLYENYSNGYSYSTQQIDFDRFRQPANCLGVFSRCTVDIRFQKEFAMAYGQHVNFYVDIFNLFNNKNYGTYDGYIGGDGQPSPTFGQPLDLATNPRSIQFGAAYRF